MKHDRKSETANIAEPAASRLIRINARGQREHLGQDGWFPAYHSSCVREVTFDGSSNDASNLRLNAAPASIEASAYEISTGACMTRKAKRDSFGRYDGGLDARTPANGLARPMPQLRVRTTVDMAPDPAKPGRLKQRVVKDANATTIAAVSDPMEPKKRLLATVNRRVDILELERSHNRISEAAYRAGRIVQAVFERSGGMPTSSWSLNDRVDTTLVRDLTMIYALDDARRITDLMRHIEGIVGSVGARFLRSILVSQHSFADVAALRGRGGERGAASVAQRFRDLLEDLSQEMVARGTANASVRATRAEPVEGEEYDERGRLVPEGEGYRVGQ